MNDKNRFWNQKIISRDGSFLQSAEWAELQEQLGKTIQKVDSPGISASAIKNNLPLGFNYFYLPRGPVLDLNLNSDEIEDRLQNFLEIIASDFQKSIFLRVEPQSEQIGIYQTVLENLGFHQVSSYQPQQTLILNLNKSEEELLGAMEHGARYSLRLAKRSGVEIKIYKELSEKLGQFENFWDLFAKHQADLGLKIYSQEYYEALLRLDSDCHSLLFVAHVEAKPIAAALIIVFGDTAIYLYSASDKNFRKMRAPALILWEAIHYAKDIAGCQKFDFWGISYTNFKWAGFTAFKKSFGGREVTYPGTWDLVLKPNWYRIYKVFKTRRLAV